MGIKICLQDFVGSDTERFRAAAAALRETPGATLVIPAGRYVIGDERSREIQRAVMSGEYGSNPQPTMFNPNFKHTIGLDLTGCRDVTVSAYGALMMIDGFMEPVRVKNASGVRIEGLSVDHVRKPFTKAVVERVEDDGMAYLRFDEATPPVEGMPALRNILYDSVSRRFGWRFVGYYESDPKPVEGEELLYTAAPFNKNEQGMELYLTNTFHSRPAVLVSHSEDTILTDVTIYSQCGIGVVGFKSRNITMTRLHVIPSPGYAMSTNTDATHFACCSGTITVENSVFSGHGDDAINVHNYYYTIKSHCGVDCVLQVDTPDGTHSQEPDYPVAGMTLGLVDRHTLAPVDTYTVVRSGETEVCKVTLDHDMPEDGEYLFANMSELPALIFRGNRVSSHLARSVLCKTHNAVIENNFFDSCTGTAVHIAAEGGWSEGVASENAAVRGNFFNCCGYNGHGRTNLASAVSLNMAADDPTGVGIHKHIVIEDNMVICPDGERDYAFNIANASDVKITGNTCVGFDKIASIAHCEDVVTDIADADAVWEDCR